MSLILYIICIFEYLKNYKMFSLFFFTLFAFRTSDLRYSLIPRELNGLVEDISKN